MAHQGPDKVFTLILRSTDRLGKNGLAGSTPANYTLDLPGVLDFNSMAKATYYAVYLDSFSVEAYYRTANTTARRALQPVEVLSGYTPLFSGYYQLCFDFVTPYKRISSGGDNSSSFIIDTDAGLVNIVSNQKFDRPIIISSTSLGNTLNVRILDDQGVQITPVLHPVTGARHLDHIIKLSIVPIY